MKSALIASFAIITLIAPSALAEDTQLSVEPGRWAWKYETIIGEASLQQTGDECIKDRPMTVESVVRDLDNACAVGDIVENGDEIAFSLTCSGDIPGQAKGRLKLGETQMKLDASGFANTLGFMAPFTFKAQADFKGAC